MKFFKIFSRDNKLSEDNKKVLDQGLAKSKTGVVEKLTRAIAGKSTVDDEVLDNLEDTLISADVGVETTIEIIDRIKARVQRDKYVKTSELNYILRDEIAQMLSGSKITAAAIDNAKQLLE